jgi:hypothetical protein
VPRHAEPITEILDEQECLRLVSQGTIGRIAFVGQFDLTVLPVNYRLVDGAILFRTGEDSLTVGDLTTRIGMRDAEYRVAFEVDHVDPETELAAALPADVRPWPGGVKDHFIRIRPVRVTGRRIRQAL